MFDLQAFEAVLALDNPNYERVLRSDLHTVVGLLRAGVYTVPQLGREMKKVSKRKWVKYARTRAYLIHSHPGLDLELRGALVKFKTRSLKKGESGAIVHVLVWESDTGDLTDLAHLRVREHVSWNAPSPVVRDHVIPEYQRNGHHMGLGNAAFTPGNIGQGNDTHSALGPFTPSIFRFEGGGQLDFRMDQVYEMSDDNGASWQAIPNSRYRIVRRVSRAGRQVCITITKSGRDSLTNTVTI